MAGALPSGSSVAWFRVESPIGAGGMGEVYRAVTPRLTARVALKVVAPEFAGDAASRERFTAEAKLAASSTIRAIVPVYAAGEADGELYLAMRLVEGESLAQRLNHASSSRARRGDPAPAPDRRRARCRASRRPGAPRRQAREHPARRTRRVPRRLRPRPTDQHRRRWCGGIRDDAERHRRIPGAGAVRRPAGGCANGSIRALLCAVRVHRRPSRRASRARISRPSTRSSSSLRRA